MIKIDIEFYRKKLLESRKTGAPVIIRDTDFKRPTWQEILKSFDNSYNTVHHTQEVGNKPTENLIGSIIEDSFYYFTNLNPNDIGKRYAEVNNFLKSIYEKEGGPSSIKINLIKFEADQDPIHLDPGDMAYWHLQGRVVWGFNEVEIKNNKVFLNKTDITDLIKDQIEINKEEHITIKTLKVRNFLSKIGKETINNFDSNIIYYEDVIFKPGDIAIIPVNCWHGYFSIGPRSGMTFRFE